MQSKNSYGTKSTFSVIGSPHAYFSLPKLEKALGRTLKHLPVSLKILLENLLRHEDNRTVRKEDIEALVHWDPRAVPDKEISFMPARVLLQDFTGVPCIVDLAVMRDAIVKMGGDPKKINPLQPVDLVIDHSIQVDEFGNPRAFMMNAEREFERNKERYAFLRWGQQAFKNFRVVPPNTGIVHQVNLEYLAQVVFSAREGSETFAYPDTLVGTDSHTPMINGLGVLGWGVGGIEAEAAMLGQPISMLIPQVVGFRLQGKLQSGATATDLVLTVTQMLRKKGVVGKFVEFFGPGLGSLSLADRATIGNMSPEYGATAGFFPVDDETLNYLRFTGRTKETVALVEAYCKEQGLFHRPDTTEPKFSDMLELDLATVEPSLAGPKRPQDRVPLSDAKRSFRGNLMEMIKGKTANINPAAIAGWVEEGGSTETTAPEPNGSDPLNAVLPEVSVKTNGTEFKIGHGSVVISAITSCTNTSNPSVMVAAGLLAKKATERGLRTKPWVKTSLAPGSKVVTDYLNESGLTKPLEELGFHLVGYGCTTCIGNSGPLPGPIAKAVEDHELVAAAVLSGNRNFEGRINPHVRANYLASPPLVVAYALAGTMDINLQTDPIGTDRSGKPVYLKDIWPTPQEVAETVGKAVKSEMFHRQYANVFEGESRWRDLPVPKGDRFEWEEKSTYIKAAPFFETMPASPVPLRDLKGARVLALLGDSVTTDHISPAGSISTKSPAGAYLIANGVDPSDFNSYGSRRGNHEVMMRGTFANIRLRNLLAPGTEGGWTIHPSSKQPISIYDAAMKYQADGIPLLVIAGKEYGSGSSRDWAAKGPRLLGVKTVIAESYERIHRSNLIGLGVLPLQFKEGQNAKSLGLTGFETYDVEGIAGDLHVGKTMTVHAASEKGEKKTFEALARLDTPNEVDYYKNDGILQYVLRQLLRL
ncbi:MAG: aconitate hydratase AcnA [Ignavibacteriales bacterium]|nr:aconitate hydratase AcnA [Ignavibacteriales bacterium]